MCPRQNILICCMWSYLCRGNINLALPGQPAGPVSSWPTPAPAATCPPLPPAPRTARTRRTLWSAGVMATATGTPARCGAAPAARGWRRPTLSPARQPSKWGSYCVGELQLDNQYLFVSRLSANERILGPAEVRKSAGGWG